MNEKKSQPEGTCYHLDFIRIFYGFLFKDLSSRVFGDRKFVIFGFDGGLAQLAVFGLRSLVVGRGIYSLRRQQVTTNKFLNSLLDTSMNKLSKLNYSVMKRGKMYVGIDQKPITNLNLRDFDRSVALIGDNRSGITKFLANHILFEMFPWWFSSFFPPRGFFLTGAQTSSSIKGWLKDQIGTTEKEDPWRAVLDLILKRRNEQRGRLFLQRLFKTSLPAFLEPQPVIFFGTSSRSTSSRI
jgi:hypothetical protein